MDLIAFAQASMPWLLCDVGIAPFFVRALGQRLIAGTYAM